MKKLRVGAASVDITPHLGCLMSGFFSERRAEEVSYPLESKAVVFDDGDMQTAYVQNDLLLMLRDDLDRAKAHAEKLTDIPQENMMMSCTHTHFGPAVAPLFMQPVENEYLDWAVTKIGDAVKLAQNRLQPAVIGHNSGTCPEETHNRRWWMEDGSVRMNPPRGSDKLVRPAGPTDPEVALLVAETTDGDPIAAICNYSLHYVGADSLTLSADYFGAFAKALQKMAGSEFTAIMANGCCGNINNVDFTKNKRYTGDYPDYNVDRVGNVLAAEAYKTWRRIGHREKTAELDVCTDFPTYRRRTAQDEADRQVAGGANAIDQIPESRADAYAGERKEVDKLPLNLQTQMQTLRIGDLAIIGFPGEFFVEYGLAAKEASPFARTMTIELANDWIGYVPTDDGLDEGSYETWLARSSKVAKGTEKVFHDSVNSCLEGISR